jgi:zinc protease
MDKETTQQVFAGTRIAVHDVKGDEELIKTFPQSAFLDYWNTWYRPESMTLVVVGDIDPQTFISQARQILGAFKARAPAREPMKAGIKPFDSVRAFVFSDPEQATAEVEFMTVKPARPPVTTASQYRRKVIEDLCKWIVNRRFSERVIRGNAPFRESSIDGSDLLHEGFTFSADALGEPRDWNKMLDATVAEIKRVIDYGFTQDEFDLAKKVVLSGDEWAVKTESTRDSTELVAEFSSAVGTDRPILSARQVLDIEKQILADVGVEELHRVFIEDFKTDKYAYVLTLPAPTNGMMLPSSEEVLAAAKVAWTQTTPATEEVAQSGSLLPGDLKAGQVISQETDKELGLTNATFANGVVMHHKFSDYKKDEAIVQITLPGGVIEETPENHGISSAAGLILAHPATSRLTSSQIRDLMIGKNIKVEGGIGLDSLTVKISGDPKDLSAGLQLTHAILTDGKLEQSALDEWKKSQLQALTARKMLPEAQLADAQDETFFGNDIRFAFFTADEISRQQREPAEAWFKRIADNAAIEVAVTGDIDLRAAIHLVAKYLGSLPKRNQDFTALDGLRNLHRHPGPYIKTVHFQGVTPKALVWCGFVGCDGLDPDRRPLSVASLILTERMMQRIRFQEQLVYSIQCQSVLGISFPGTGSISAGTPTDPKNADKLSGTILEMFKAFAADGPTEDELTDAKKQFANQFVAQINDPTFWNTQISQMNYRHRTLDDLRAIPAIYQTFTVQQVRDAVRKCVTEDRLIRIEAIPDISAPSTLPAAAAGRNPAVKPF